jgi:putative YphP/YqiW family bacilliredoxin
MEREAVARLREAFAPHPPSSPQFALLEEGRLVRLWPRQEIEGRSASEIAQSVLDELATPRP